MHNKKTSEMRLHFNLGASTKLPSPRSGVINIYVDLAIGEENYMYTLQTRNPIRH